MPRSVNETFYRLTVAEVKPEADDAVSIRLAVPPSLADRFAFAAGQFLTLRATLDGKEARRCYSLCSDPASGELRIGVRRLPEGLFSTYATSVLRAGDPLDVAPPAGTFTLAPDPAGSHHYLAFAAGSGITPVLAHIKAVLRGEPGSRITLFYANRSSASIMFRAELDQLASRYAPRLTVHHFLSRENGAGFARAGRPSAREWRRYEPRIEPAHVRAVLLCAPPAMVAEYREQLPATGIEPHRIHFEIFTPAHAATPAHGVAAQATVILDGRRHSIGVAAGQTVLDAALDAGLDAPHSCLQGACRTCRARRLAGDTEMALNFALDDEEVAQGYILTCQSRVLGAGVVVSYDED